MSTEFRSSPEPCPWRNLIDGKALFLASAVLFLFGIYRLSVDPKAFSTDLAQIAFSFGSLEFYQVLQIAAACFFASRLIWDHAFLLVFLQGCLVLTPFMLMSHAVFLGHEVTWTLLSIACAGAIFLMSALRTRLPHMNLPWQSVLAGGLMLALNATVPILFRAGLEHENDFWQSISPWIWNFWLPGLASLLLLIPARKSTNSFVFASTSWPFLLQGLWLVGTVVHLHSISYVDDQKFSWARFLPFVYAMSWVAAFRFADIVPKPQPNCVIWLHRTPFLLAWLPLVMSDSAGLWAFAAINAVLYQVLRMRAPGEKLAGFVSASFALFIAACPIGWLNLPEPDAVQLRLRLVEIAAGGFIAYQALRTKKPALSLITALGLAGALFEWGNDRPWAACASVDIAWLFLLIHSVFWTKQHPLEKLCVLGGGAFLWSFSTIASYSAPVLATHLLGLASASLTLLFVILAKKHFQKLLFEALAFLSLVAGLGWPMLHLGQAFSQTSFGFKLITLSLLLFGAAFCLAIWRTKKSPITG